MHPVLTDPQVDRPYFQVVQDGLDLQWGEALPGERWPVTVRAREVTLVGKTDANGNGHALSFALWRPTLHEHV